MARAQPASVAETAEGPRAKVSAAMKARKNRAMNWRISNLAAKVTVISGVGPMGEAAYFCCIGIFCCMGAPLPIMSCIIAS